MPLGSELRQQRLMLGMSLEQIADDTKLPLRQLELLEQDALSQLPGGIFRRGLVRAYCNCLHVAPDEWLERLNASEEAAADGSEDWATFARNVQRTRVTTGGAPRIRWMGVLLMLAALAAAGWALWHFILRTRLGH